MDVPDIQLRRAALAHVAGFYHLAAIAARAGERDAECAGHGRFRPAGIRRAVMFCITPDGAPCFARGGTFDEEGGEDEEEGAQARGWQVDEVVEAGGGPAESFMARRTVADHAVGGIGGLVGDAAGKAENAGPEGRGHDAIGKVFRKAFDGGAADGGLVELFGIAADNHRDGLAAGLKAFMLQRIGDGVHMGFEALLGGQGGGKDDEKKKACRDLPGDDLQGERDGDGKDQQDDERDDAHALAGGIILGLLVPFPVEPRYHTADPCDRVADGAIEPVGISDKALDDQAEEGEKEHFVAGSAFGGPIQHGGNLARARALFPEAREPWIDLSTGINPYSYPYSPIPANAFSRLPEPDALSRLCALAAESYGAPASEMIVAAPGTQILLPIIAGLAKQVSGGNNAIVLSPTYAEHARAAAMAGFEVSETDDLDRLAEGQLAIVVNPNNPTGRMVAKADLLALAGLMRAKGGLLVVDEAFIDVSEAESVAAHVGEGGLVVLKSFGKFYGLAGVRLGFAMSQQEIVSRVDERLGPWAVSGPALHIAGEALSDGPWQMTMREQLRRDAGRLDALLDQASVRVSGGTTLFRFVRDGEAQALFQRLGEAGIMTRRFEERPDDLRIGLPGEGEWERLAAALGI